MRVCLLLNTLYSTGLSYVDIFEIREVFHALKSSCDALGWELFVRPKPSGSAPNVLANSLGLPLADVLAWTAKPMADVVAATDICVNYGEVTTALSLFHAVGAKLICHWGQRYPDNFWTLTELEHVRTRTVDELQRALVA